MIANKDTYFKSEEIKNSLTLPSIFNRNATLEEDDCRPDSTINYQAQYPAGENFAAHFDVGNPPVKYTCVGSFGHVYGIPNEGSIIDFSLWIDESNNSYQASTHITWPTELYWMSKINQFIPPPVPDPYGTGWKMQPLNSNNDTGDGGKNRALFCRFNAFQRIYAERSGGIGRPQKNIYCSSKWADVTMSEALGLFLITSLN
jgi:hypothetical protein